MEVKRDTNKNGLYFLKFVLFFSLNICIYCKSLTFIDIKLDRTFLCNFTWKISQNPLVIQKMLYIYECINEWEPLYLYSILLKI